MKKKRALKLLRTKNTGRITWDSEKDLANPLEVNFTPQEMEYLRKGCEQYTESEAPAPDDFWALVEKVYNAGE